MFVTTASIVPYLPTDQTEKLMQLVEASSCAKYHLSDSQRNFISLIKAVGNKRDSALSHGPAFRIHS